MQTHFNVMVTGCFPFFFFHFSFFLLIYSLFHLPRMAFTLLCLILPVLSAASPIARVCADEAKVLNLRRR